MSASFKFMQAQLDVLLKDVPLEPGSVPRQSKLENKIPFTSSIVAYALSLSAYYDCIYLSKLSFYAKTPPFAKISPMKSPINKTIIGISISADIIAFKVFISLTFSEYTFYNTNNTNNTNATNKSDNNYKPVTLLFFLHVPTNNTRRQNNNIINNIVVYLILRYVVYPNDNNKMPDLNQILYPDPDLNQITDKNQLSDLALNQKSNQSNTITVNKYVYPYNNFRASARDIKTKITQNNFHLFELDTVKEINPQNLLDFNIPEPLPMGGGISKKNLNFFYKTKTQKRKYKKTQVKKISKNNLH